MLECCSVDVEVYIVVCVGWVEYGVVGFGWVWYQVVGVKVGDEIAEFCLCELL